MFYDGPFSVLDYGEAYRYEGGYDDLEYRISSRLLVARGCPECRRLQRPMPHSACTARTAFSNPSRLTTMAMVSSLEPWAMAIMFTFSREMAVKMRPAMPGLPCMPSPTTARRPTFSSTWIGCT